MFSEDDLGIPSIGISMGDPNKHQNRLRRLNFDPVHVRLETGKIILGEAQNVIASMKLNARWKEQPIYPKCADPLLNNLVVLKTKLETSLDLAQTMKPSEYLNPFLDVIKSDIANGPITSVALSSVFKFLQYGFFDLQESLSFDILNYGTYKSSQHSDRHHSDEKLDNFENHQISQIQSCLLLLASLESIINAAISCRFEATDPDTDQVVLFKILKILSKCIQTNAGLLLSDQILYDMVQTCFKMSIQPRVSPLLRRSAEMTLTEIFQFVFTCVDHPLKSHLSAKIFKKEDEMNKSKEDEKKSNDEQKEEEKNSNQLNQLNQQQQQSIHNNNQNNLNNQNESSSIIFNTQGVSFVKSEESLVSSSLLLQSPSKSSISSSNNHHHHSSSSASSQIVLPDLPAPFGSNCLVKLLRFLCTMINPKDTSTTEPMRYLGLTLANIILEIRGASLQENQQLFDIVSNEVCRFIIQCVRTETNLSLLSLTFRICYNLFSTLRNKLHFQLEVFLKSALSFFPEFEVILTGKVQTKSTKPSKSSSSGQQQEIVRTIAQQELAMDVIVQLCRDPNFAVDLFVLYDCELKGPNMLDMLVMFLQEVSNNYDDLESKNLKMQAYYALSSILKGMATRLTSIKSYSQQLQQQQQQLQQKQPNLQQQQEHQDHHHQHHQQNHQNHQHHQQNPILLHFDSLSPTVDTKFGTVPSSLSMSERRYLKSTLKSGAEIFNNKPKDGLAYLVERGALADPLTPKSVAHLLRTNPFINKATIGEYFAERKDFNYQVLHEYCLSFDWEGREFLDIFREYLESFRLPGEAPAIEKILDVWSKLYYEKWNQQVVVQVDSEQKTSDQSNEQTTSKIDASQENSETQTSSNDQKQHQEGLDKPSEDKSGDKSAEKPQKTETIVVKNTHPIFRSLDACYLICMSIVLLNVDMYSPNVKNNRRMSSDQYVNNLKGQNGTDRQNFPPEFLRSIYASIRESEIRIAEEHLKSGTLEIPQSTWQSQWSKQQIAQHNQTYMNQLNATLSAGHFYGLYDDLIFSSIWRPLLASTKVLWIESTGPEMLETLTNTFYSMGILAAHFKLTASFDYLIVCLTELTTILLPYKDYSFEVRFTQDKKAQASTSVLFDLCHQYPNVIREGWKSINDIMIRLQSLSTLPPILEEVVDDSVFRFKELPPPASSEAIQTPKANTSSPIVSMWTNLWKWGSGAAAAAVNSAVENQDQDELPAELERFRNATKQILVDCHLPDVITSCSRVDTESLLFFLQVLILGSTPKSKSNKTSQQPQSNQPDAQIESNNQTLEDSSTMRPPATPNKRNNKQDSSTESVALQSPNSSQVGKSNNNDNNNDIKISNQSPDLQHTELGEFVVSPLNDSSSQNSLQHPQPVRPSSQTTLDVTLEATLDASPSVQDVSRLPSDSPKPSKIPVIASPVLPQSPSSHLHHHRNLAPKPGSKDRFEDSVALYCVDMLAHLTLLNAHRVSLVWPVVSSHLIDIISASDKPTSLTEKAICNLLLIVAKLLPVAVGVPVLVYDGTTSEPIASDTTVAYHMARTIQHTLGHSSLHSTLSKVYAHKISHASRVILRRSAKVMNNASQAEWQALIDSVASCMSDTPEHIENFIDVVSSCIVRGILPESLATAASGFATRNDSTSRPKIDHAFLSSSLITNQNIRAVHGSVLKVLTRPETPLDAVAEGMDCVQVLLVLGPKMLPPNHSDDNLWHSYMLNTFILPILGVLSSLTRDSRVVVRQTSLSQLQKAFLSPGLSFADSNDWLILFNKIIFPLVDSIIMPAEEGPRAVILTKDATEETHTRAVALLTKAFLHCSSKLSQQELRNLWMSSLKRYSVYSRKGGSEVVEEAVVESIKNALSVLLSAGVFVTKSPQESDPEFEMAKMKYEFWTECWMELDQFAPNVRADFAAISGISPPQMVKPVQIAVENTEKPISNELATTIAVAESTSPQRTSSPVNPPGTVLEL